MSAILALGFGRVVLPLAAWLVVFIGLTYALSIPGLLWCKGRMRTFSSGSPGTTGTRLWCCRIWIPAVHLILLPIIAVVAAVPFSLERSTARLLERSAPRAVQWAISLGSRTAMQTLAVDGDATLIDLSGVANQVHPRVQALESRIREARFVVSRIPLQLETNYLEAASDAAQELMAADPRVTWFDLSEAANRRVTATASESFGRWAAALRIASLRHVVGYAATFLIAQAVTFLLVLALMRTR